MKKNMGKRIISTVLCMAMMVAFGSLVFATDYEELPAFNGYVESDYCDLEIIEMLMATRRNNNPECGAYIELWTPENDVTPYWEEPLHLCESTEFCIVELLTSTHNNNVERGVYIELWTPENDVTPYWEEPLHLYDMSEMYGIMPYSTSRFWIRGLPFSFAGGLITTTADIDVTRNNSTGNITTIHNPLSAFNGSTWFIAFPNYSAPTSNARINSHTSDVTVGTEFNASVDVRLGSGTNAGATVNRTGTARW